MYIRRSYMWMGLIQNVSSMNSNFPKFDIKKELLLLKSYTKIPLTVI
jgi:hypothetical protein